MPGTTNQDSGPQILRQDTGPWTHGQDLVKLHETYSLEEIYSILFGYTEGHIEAISNDLMQESFLKINLRSVLN